MSGWIFALLALSALAGCSGRTPSKPQGPYATTLHDDEHVEKAVPYGQFTVLSVVKTGGGSYMTSMRLDYMRLIHRDKILIDEARAIVPWPGLDSPTFFAEYYVDNYWKEFLIHEAAGKPVVEHIDQGPERDDTRRIGTEGFRYGYPWRQGVRYMPRARMPGFMLTASPLSVRVLPYPPELKHRLEAYTLAAMSPDEQSFAYVDSMDAPTFVMVVDEQGARRDPIPIPRVDLPPRPDADVNPYERVRNWFNATYTWKRDSNGHWAAEPVVLAQRSAVNPVEEIFLSERTGYRQCFTSADAHCLANWHQATRAEVMKAEPGDGDMPLAYAPSVPMQAFGANVKMLAYGTSYWNNSGYFLYADGTPAQVVAEYVKRLESRKIVFVRSDQCPRPDGGDADCDEQLKSRLKITATDDDWLGKRLRNTAPGVTTFVLPDLVISVSASAKGGTIIQTQYRGAIVK